MKNKDRFLVYVKTPYGNFIRVVHGEIIDDKGYYKCEVRKSVFYIAVDLESGLIINHQSSTLYRIKKVVSENRDWINNLKKDRKKLIKEFKSLKRTLDKQHNNMLINHVTGEWERW